MPHHVYLNRLKCLFLAISLLSITIELKANKYGFIENKGQIINQNGLPNNDVLYLLNSNQLKVQLRKNGFSYEIYKTTKKLAQKSELEGILAKNISGNFSDSFNYTFHSHRIDFDFFEPNGNAKIIAHNPLADYINYYTPNCGEKGITGVNHYSKILYQNIYPNIDIEFLFEPKTGKSFKYNFILHRGADINKIRFEIKGARSIKVERGNLVINTSNGHLYEKIPYSFYAEQGQSNGKRTEIAVYFKKHGSLYGFETKHQILKSQTLVIDPAPWLTYFGGTGDEYAYDIVNDNLNNIYSCGFTSSTTHIATNGSFQQTFSANFDAVLFKLNSNGNMLWSTYYGGQGFDYGISLDLIGNKILFSGITGSDSIMATSNVHQSIYGGGSSDVFIAEFNIHGFRQWSTYYGGAGNESWISNNWIIPMQTIYDADTNIFLVASSTSQNNIATNGTHQNTMASPIDAILVKFDKNGIRIWGTYYGGWLDCLAAGAEYGSSVTIDKANNIYIAGYTMSRNGIATPNAHELYLNPNCIAGCSSFSPCGSMGGKGMLAKFNPNGQRIWGTYFSSNQELLKIKADNNANIYIAGNNSNTVSKFDSSGKFISGYWNGFSGRVISLDINEDNDIIVCGFVLSTNNSIGTSGAPQLFPAGDYDGYIVKYDKDLNKIWGTYMGGSNFDMLNSIKFTGKNTFVYTGRSNSSGLAMPNVYQDSLMGGTDFIVCLNNDTNRFISVNNVITGNQLICPGFGADTLIGSFPLPNDTNFCYLWLYSNSGLANTFIPANQFATYTKKDLIINTISSNIWFKRIVRGYGIIDTSSSINIQVGAKPSTGFVFDSLPRCAGTPMFFADTTTNITSRMWYIGSNPLDTTSQQSFTKQFYEPNIYTIKLITNHNGCIDSIERRIRSANYPNAGFTVNNPSQNQLSNLFVFSNTTTVGFPDSVAINIWSIGNNTLSTQTNPTINYNQSGLYQVKLFAQTTIGCSDSIFDFISVYDADTITNNRIDSSHQFTIGTNPNKFIGSWPNGTTEYLFEDFTHSNPNDSNWIPFGWQSNLHKPYLGGQNSFMRIDSNSGQIISYNSANGRYVLISPPFKPTLNGDSIRLDVAAKMSVHYTIHPPINPPVYYGDSLILWVKVNNVFTRLKSWSTKQNIDTVDGITTALPEDDIYPPTPASKWASITAAIPANTQQIKFELVKGSVNGISLDRIMLDTSNKYSFIWQQSNIGINGPFTNAYGTYNLQHYQAPSLTFPMWYRRLATSKYGKTDTSNTILVTPVFNGNTYFNKTGLALNQLSSWGTNPDGSGIMPTSFNVSNTAFIAHNTYPLTLSNDLIISGNNSFLSLGNPNASSSLTLSSGNVISADSIVLRRGASVDIKGNIITNNLIAEDSTNVLYTSISPQNIIPTNYFNLQLLASQKQLINDVTVRNSLLLNAPVQTNSNTLIIGASASQIGQLIYQSGYINGKLKRFFAKQTNLGNNTGLFPIVHPTNNHARHLLLEYTQAPLQGGSILAEFIANTPSGNINTYDSSIFWQVLNLNRITNNGYWKIKTDNISGGRFNINASAEFLPNMINYTVLRLVWRPDSLVNNWSIQGTSLTPMGSNSFPIVRCTQMFEPNGELTIASDSVFNALPVKLVDFNAKWIDLETIRISWKTTQEINSSHFNVYRSYDAKTWHWVGKQNALNHSNNIKQYAINDNEFETATKSTNIYYKLESVDLDGSSSFSNMVLVNQQILNKQVTAYPNPFGSQLKVECYNDKQLNITLTDIAGKTIFKKQVESNKIEIEIDRELAKGIYFININGHTIKLLKD